MPYLVHSSLSDVQNTTFRAKQHFLLHIDVTYFKKGGLNAGEASYHFRSLSKSIMEDKKTSSEDDKLGNIGAEHSKMLQRVWLEAKLSMD